MAVTVSLPAEALHRIEAEAARRKVTIDVVIADLAERLPQERARSDRRLPFVGFGSSGDTRPIDVRRERAELAKRKLAEGI